MCGKGVHQIPFAQVDLERATRYSGEDSEMALQLHQTLWPQLEAEPGLRFVYAQLEMPTLALLQRAGYSREQALAQLDQMINQQAFTMAATDLFWLSSVLFIVLVTLVWLSKPTLRGAGAAGSGAD